MPETLSSGSLLADIHVSHVEPTTVSCNIFSLQCNYKITYSLLDLKQVIFLFNSLIFKNNPFVAPTGVHNRQEETRKTIKSITFSCFDQVRFCITIEDSFKRCTAFLQCPAHNTRKDKVNMHTKVRLVIVGTFLFIIVELNESVSTFLHLFLWMANEYLQELYCSMKKR